MSFKYVSKYIANTLAYTIYLVSQHSEVDEKLYEELSNIFTDDDDDDAILDLNQINAMNYLTMAISVDSRLSALSAL